MSTVLGICVVLALCTASSVLIWHGIRRRLYRARHTSISRFELSRILANPVNRLESTAITNMSTIVNDEESTGFYRAWQYQEDAGGYWM